MSHTIAVFDLDGTLLDTLDDLTSAVNFALSRKGFPARTRNEVRSFIGSGVRMLMRRAVPADADDATVLSALADFKAHYADNCQVMTAPYPGVLELLDALRARGVRIAVASNKFDAAVKALCAHYFGDRIDFAVGEREADGIRRKPAPDTVFAALRALDGAPADAVYIGDSDTDILTAAAAGLPCISVTWGFRDADFLLAHGATAMAETAEELLDMI